MADAEARFVISLDTSAGQSAGAALGSALEQLKARINNDTKALQELQGSLQRLRGSADVLRFEAAGKGLVTAQAEASKLQSKLVELQSKLAGTSDTKIGRGLQAQIATAQGALGAAQAKASALTAQRDKLGQTAAVKAYQDTLAAIKGRQSSLSAAQVELSRLGGSLTATASGAQEAGGGLGLVGEKLATLKGLGAAGIFLAVASAAVTAAVAIGGALVALGRFVLTAGDASRTLGIYREATAGSAEGGKVLAESIERVQSRVGGSREELEALALGMRRLGMQGEALESSIEAVRSTSRIFGAQAGSTIQGIIDRAQRFRAGGINLLELRGSGLEFNDVAKALATNMKVSMGVASTALTNGRVKVDDLTRALRDASRVKTGAALEKLALALPEQMERARMNVAKIFALDTTTFSRNLSGVLGILDQSTESGRRLHEIVKELFQPLLDSDAVRVVLENMVLNTLDLTIGFLSMAVAIKGANDKLKEFTGGFGFLEYAAEFFEPIVHDEIKIPRALEPPQMGAGTKLGGEALVDGISAGIDERTPALMKKMEGLGPSLAGAFDKGIERRSPSRLFRVHARDIPRGAALGIEDESGRVSSAIAAMASPDDMKVDASAGGRGGNGGGHGDVYISAINIDARGSGPDDMKSNQGFREALVEVLEDAVRQAGLRVVRFT